jgi:predicted ribosome quality control (RQC) complex YloA/Tae2 family protein
LQKKEFTSFDTAAAVRELQSKITHSRLSNIYQFDPKTFLFKLHKPEVEQLNLIMESGRRIHLTSYNIEKPEMPPAFCMALRSHLRNASLESVEQYEFERVVFFSFMTGEGKIRLILELFGEGNMIVVGKNDEILQALIYKRMRDRSILRGEGFSFAPSSARNPLVTSKKELSEGLIAMKEAEIVRALTRTIGIGGIYAEEVLLRANIEKSMPCSALNEKKLDAVYNELNAMLKQVNEGVLEPCIVLDKEDGFLDVSPLRLRIYAEQGMKFQLYSDFNQSLDEFFVRITAVQKATSGIEVDDLRREADRLKRIIEEQQQTIAAAEKQSEMDKGSGDVIYAHSQEIQSLLDTFSIARQSGIEFSQTAQEIISKNKTGENKSNFLQSFDARRRLAKVKIDGCEFVLDIRKNLYENAAAYYEQSKHARQKITGAKAALEESHRNLTEVEFKIAKVETLDKARPAETIEALVKRKIRHKEWFEKFRWFVSSDGFLIVAGKDSVSNEVLIKKHTEKNDVVFHGDITGAPFVVVKTGEKEPNERVLYEAAEFAAAFSRGWREGYASIDVYWVKPEQLTKTPQPGEFVPHGAFVVAGKRNWMRNTALTTSIGAILMENKNVEFVGGPLEAVKAKTNVYLTLAPGHLEGKEFFKRIIATLAKQFPKDSQERIFKTSIEEIREFVPYGSGRIVGDKD